MKTADSPYNINQASKLKNPIQTYAWGSHTDIQRLMGHPPTPEPWAELWMGAHPVAPSHVFMNNKWISLDTFIHQSPGQILGKKTAKAYQNTLPFLFKLLAAEKPLSIQAHPDGIQAKNGFDRENLLGIAPNDPRRNYKDSRHKPECICALTAFTGLKGFRKVDDIAAQLALLCPENLLETMAMLRTNGLKPFFKALLTFSIAQKTAIIREALQNAKKHAHENPVFEWVLTLSHYYPDDIGILSPAVLNLFHLAPGEALFLPAGELHAYLAGFGIELMANSDNVLRGGLTPKHIDVPELLNVLNFSESTVSILRPENVSDSEAEYPAFAEEFSLHIIHVTNTTTYASPAHRGPEILLCAQGTADLFINDPAASIRLDAGESAFIPASAAAYTITGNARIYKAGVPA